MFGEMERACVSHDPEVLWHVLLETVFEDNGESKVTEIKLTRLGLVENPENGRRFR
jgi:hypothetical protein